MAQIGLLKFTQRNDVALEQKSSHDVTVKISTNENVENASARETPQTLTKLPNTT